jgi:hypothetical protein
MAESLSSLIEKALTLEREAHQLHSESKIQEAFEAYDKAASFYREAGEHLKSAFCFASAATCWNIHTGFQPIHNAATRNHYAAQEAMKARNYDYARMLFHEAAMLYEKEGDGENYSVCFMQAQVADAKHCRELWMYGKKDEKNIFEVKWKDRFTALIRWSINTMSRWVWGYGERPLRTFFTGWFILVFCALIYQYSGKVLVHGVVRPITYFEALYLSVITFSTVGYGDYLPGGGARIVSVFLGFSGIFLPSLFLVALTRRYLRMYR